MPRRRPHRHPPSSVPCRAATTHLRRCAADAARRNARQSGSRVKRLPRLARPWRMHGNRPHSAENSFELSMIPFSEIRGRSNPPQFGFDHLIRKLIHVTRDLRKFSLARPAFFQNALEKRRAEPLSRSGPVNAAFGLRSKGEAVRANPPAHQEADARALSVRNRCTIFPLRCHDPKRFGLALYRHFTEMSQRHADSGCVIKRQLTSRPDGKIP